MASVAAQTNHSATLNPSDHLGADAMFPFPLAKLAVSRQVLVNGFQVSNLFQQGDTYEGNEHRAGTSD
jgi:hypothetical protein